MAWKSGIWQLPAPQAIPDGSPRLTLLPKHPTRFLQGCHRHSRDGVSSSHPPWFIWEQIPFPFSPALSPAPVPRAPGGHRGGYRDVAPSPADCHEPSQPPWLPGSPRGPEGRGGGCCGNSTPRSAHIEPPSAPQPRPPLPTCGAAGAAPAAPGSARGRETGGKERCQKDNPRQDLRYETSGFSGGF